MSRYPLILNKSYLDTPLGSLLALADERVLYLLEFVDRPDLDRKIDRLFNTKQALIKAGAPDPICSIATELEQYFSSGLKEFKTPVCFIGTSFQQQVWRALEVLVRGTTQPYSDVAAALGKPTAYRAVAQAISANHLFIVIPCHRVINSNGTLGGYGGGVSRKEWLINHERIKGSCG